MTDYRELLVELPDAAIIALADPSLALAAIDECAKVMPAGAHVAVYAPSNQLDVVGISLRLAGFEVRDTIPVVGETPLGCWMIARRDTNSSVVDLMMSVGLGGINVGAVRLGGSLSDGLSDSSAVDGRYPANVVFADSGARQLDADTKGTVSTGGSGDKSGKLGYHGGGSGDVGSAAGGYGDSGGVSRYFMRVPDDADEIFDEMVAWLMRLFLTPEGRLLAFAHRIHPALRAHRGAVEVRMP